MKTAEEYKTSLMWCGGNTLYEKIEWTLKHRDNEWRQKIQDAFNSTMNFHTREILKKLLGQGPTGHIIIDITIKIRGFLPISYSHQTSI